MPGVGVWFVASLEYISDLYKLYQRQCLALQKQKALELEFLFLPMSFFVQASAVSPFPW